MPCLDPVGHQASEARNAVAIAGTRIGPVTRVCTGLVQCAYTAPQLARIARSRQRYAGLACWRRVEYPKGAEHRWVGFFHQDTVDLIRHTTMTSPPEELCSRIDAL